MPGDEELPIIRAFYDFVLWLNPKIASLSATNGSPVSRGKNASSVALLSSVSIKVVPAG